MHQSFADNNETDGFRLLQLQNEMTSNHLQQEIEQRDDLRQRYTVCLTGHYNISLYYLDIRFI